MNEMNGSFFDSSFPVVGMVDLGMLLLKLLAVAGGGVLGGAGAGFCANRVTKMTVRKQAPKTLVLGSRIAGCVAAGLGVWLWAFGNGGSGLGFGSGGLGAGGSGYIGYDRQPEKENKQPESKAGEGPNPPAAPEPPVGLRSARIEMLGGNRVQQDRFYVMDEQLPPRTLAELEQTLLARKSQEKDPIKAIEIVIYEDSVDKEHPAVRDLQQWAQSNGLQVTISFPRGNRS
jgi:hypothetical protein